MAGRFALAAFALLAVPASADRITEMEGTDLCVYKTKLAVAGYLYFLKGTPRSEIKIRWHGDETPNEIEFVTRTLDEAYMEAEADRHDHPGEPLSEDAFGDRIYSACVSGDRT